MPSNKPNPSQPEEKKAFSFSHTKLATFRRCLQQYHWKYIDGYYPPSSSGQVRGTAGHAALSVWHTIYDMDAALDKAWEVWETNVMGPGDDWDLLQSSLERYFNWSLQNKDAFIVKVAEQEFQIDFEVPPYKLRHKDGSIHEHNTIHMYGFIDGIVEEKGYLWLLENKFYKRMDNSPLDLDPQVSTYMLAALLLEYPVQGVIYNIVRVADTKIAVTEPVVRRKLHRSTEGLGRIQDEIILQVRRMIAYQNGGEPYRTPTKDCHWDCPFYSACLLYNDDGKYPKQQLNSIVTIRSSKHGTSEEEQQSDTGIEHE